jgi:lipoprotein-anchoring transpeptidase ErfK/SrfK
LLAGLAGTGFVSGSPAQAEFDAAMRVSWVQPVQLTEQAIAPPGVPVRAIVDLSNQTMQVFVADQLVDTFKVSTGRKGFGTPPGEYQAEWMVRMWRSRKYNYAPMPWAVFFHGGYAIHGTTEVRRLGRMASHGCVRLHPDNAKKFFALVMKNGRDNTTITIVR